MAEAFGVTAGALSIAGLFNNCVDCFEYIQLGRNFGRDFHSSQLRLDMAKVRLSRWGEAVDIAGENTQITSDTEALACEVLWQILVLFSNAAEVSERLQPQVPNYGDVYDPKTDMGQASLRLHEKQRLFARRRLRDTQLFKKISWGLYQYKNMDRLVRSITDLIEDLEKLLPETKNQQQLRNLVENEVVELDHQDLQIIHERADDTDPLLKEAVNSEIERPEGYRTGNLKTTDEARLGVGDEYSDAAVSSGYQPKRMIPVLVGHVEASGKSKVQVGTRYGGRSMMAD
ncbi:hypothetical protein IFM53868_07163 [Aspergillus udagawae]|uniref:Prion-inhibition and propagation HeLo domain-containing protein n=1 Tax=Aspergillus udagawae TaxID=91492 RepID=A0ABQ1B467_9EURO|nr:hypothetical protein IFM53868_07163 [Aspergillus udagawae]